MNEVAETPIRIGTRGSKLALWQANEVANCLKRNFPEVETEICVIRTTGDKVQNKQLSKIGGKGLFTKELEQAIDQGEVDICVHSMKDVPSELPEGMGICAMLPRADVRDVLVASPNTTIEALPAGARVGTGSLRRRAQLCAMRPDLDYVEIRGNLDTRIGKVKSGELDAAVLAAAGIDRMGWDECIAQRIDPSVLIPAVGQGAIGIEARLDDRSVLEICDALNDADTMACVNAERLLMKAMDGGCQAPFGAWACIDGTSTITLTAFAASADGARIAKASCAGARENIHDLAKQAEAQLVGQGAREILEEARLMCEED